MTEFWKSEVNFESPADGEDRCEDCVHFIPEHEACKIVRGEILPEDWCDQFKVIERA